MHLQNPFVTTGQYHSKVISNHTLISNQFLQYGYDWLWNWSLLFALTVIDLSLSALMTSYTPGTKMGKCKVIQKAVSLGSEMCHRNKDAPFHFSSSLLMNSTCLEVVTLLYDCIHLTIYPLSLCQMRPSLGTAAFWCTAWQGSVAQSPSL